MDHGPPNHIGKMMIISHQFSFGHEVEAKQLSVVAPVTKNKRYSQISARFQWSNVVIFNVMPFLMVIQNAL